MRLARILDAGVWGLLIVVPLCLFVTAIGKLLAWEEFEASLATYSLVPAPLQTTAAVLVPAAETAAFVMFLVGYRIRASLLSIAIVAVFFFVTLWHWLANVPPECACMGMWAEYWQIDESAVGVLRRDAFLIGIATVAVVLAWGRRRLLHYERGEADVVAQAC